MHLKQMNQHPATRQFLLLSLLLCIHTSCVLASSRGPPPPPPPRNDRNSYDDRYNEQRRNEYIDSRGYDGNNRGYDRSDPVPRRRDRREGEERNLPMDPSRRPRPASNDGPSNAFANRPDADRIERNEDFTGDRSDAENEQQKTYNPIDYKFPSKGNESYGNDAANDDDLPKTGDEDRDRRNGRARRPDSRPGSDFTSARQDAVARYTATNLGKMKLATSSFCVGGAAGGFIGKSLLNQGQMFALMTGFLFWIMSLIRNDYGEMARSLGLGSIYLLRRTKAVRKRYRTGVHLKGMWRFGPRTPFPPVSDGEEENPWKYVPQSRDDPDFEMIKALLCMVLIGSFCGGNVPLIPTWMGSAGGAATFAIFGIAKNARGDLIRTMGMRVVALIGEAMRINAELNVARKVARVGGKIFDKMMILDSKHRIKDRIVKGASWAYEKASNTAARVQEDIKEGRETDNDRRRPEREMNN